MVCEQPRYTGMTTSTGPGRRVKRAARGLITSARMAAWAGAGVGCCMARADAAAVRHSCPGSTGLPSKWRPSRDCTDIGPSCPQEPAGTARRRGCASGRSSVISSASSVSVKERPCNVSTGSLAGSAGCQAQPDRPASLASTTPSTAMIAATPIGLPRQATPSHSTSSERAACHPAGSRRLPPERILRTGTPSRLTTTSCAAPICTNPSISSPHHPGNPAVRATAAASARSAAFGTLVRSAAAVAEAARPSSPSRRAQAATPTHA